jgi:UDP-2,3-diacylglucosamine hydrolase
VPAFTAFISDLHLSRDRPDATRVFLEFLSQVACKADGLYILGDLFEYWAGDDDLRDAFNRSIATGLAATVSGGVPVMLMHGNRDFLMSSTFAGAAGARLLPDPTTVDLYGIQTLLMHGDTLCTEDRRYQSFRRRVRNPLWQNLFMLQPLSWRRAEIERARRVSESQKRTKSAQIMDVTPAAVTQALRESNCTRLIHGHTHRPARHEHVVDGRRCERWVLSDWYQTGQYLRVGRDGCESVLLPFR